MGVKHSKGFSDKNDPHPHPNEPTHSEKFDCRDDEATGVFPSVALPE